MRLQRGIAAGLALLMGSCVSLRFDRDRVNEPVDDGSLQALVPGQAHLADVLDQLGAPTIVWPSLNGRVVMAYAWLDQCGLGISVSTALQRSLSARVRWDSEDLEIPAIVVELDPELRLEVVRRGLLRDLVPEPLEGNVEPDDVSDSVRSLRG
ncbi:MAG: hypothetical protein RL562_87 [Planctomycetota bacterium]